MADQILIIVKDAQTTDKIYKELRTYGIAAERLKPGQLKFGMRFQKGDTSFDISAEEVIQLSTAALQGASHFAKALAETLLKFRDRIEVYRKAPLHDSAVYVPLERKTFEQWTRQDPG